jgi:hypothetical protein
VEWMQAVMLVFAQQRRRLLVPSLTTPQLRQPNDPVRNTVGHEPADLTGSRGELRVCVVPLPEPEEYVGVVDPASR